MKKKKRPQFKIDPPASEKKLIEPPNHDLLPEHTESQSPTPVQEEQKEKMNNVIIKTDEAREDKQEEKKQADQAVVLPQAEDTQVVKPSTAEPDKAETIITPQPDPTSDGELVKDVSMIDTPKKEEKAEKSAVENNTEEVGKEDLVLAQEVNVPVAQTLTAVPPTQSNVDLPPNNPSNKKIIISALTVLGLLLLVIGIWTFNSQQLNQAKRLAASAKSAQPTIVPLSLPVSPRLSPTSVASSEVKLNRYPVRVLNGSGIAGEATKVKIILETEGFRVSQTGNADNFAYSDTLIRSKKNVEKAVIDQLKTLLSKSYSIGKEESLSASESSELTVIIGSKKAK